jgi:hypothetical protein
MGSGGGKSGVNLPSFGNVDLSQSMANQGADIASNFSSHGMGDSTNETQAQIGNTLNWDQKQFEANNQLQQQLAQDELQQNNLQGSGGFLSGLIGGGIPFI